jgi:hypothetical protein
LLLLHLPAGLAKHPAARLQVRAQQHLSLPLLLLLAAPAGHPQARLQATMALHKRVMNAASGMADSFWIAGGSGRGWGVAHYAKGDAGCYDTQQKRCEKCQGGARWWWMIAAPRGVNGLDCGGDSWLDAGVCHAGGLHFEAGCAGDAWLIWRLLVQGIRHWHFWMLQALRYPERMRAAVLQQDWGAC